MNRKRDLYMDFRQALEALKKGYKVKLPTWKGYWVKEGDTIKMHCKDGAVLDIRETQDVFYTLSNIVSNEWEIVGECTDDLTVCTFRFGEALRHLKAGKKVARQGWNGKGMFIYLQEGSKVETGNLRCDAIKGYCESRAIQHVNINPHIDMKAADGSVVIGWLASQTDMLAEDWVLVE